MNFWRESSLFDDLRDAARTKRFWAIVFVSIVIAGAFWAWAIYFTLVVMRWMQMHYY